MLASGPPRKSEWFTATDVPPGIDQADHEAGIVSSLANLASYVETAS